MPPADWEEISQAAKFQETSIRLVPVAHAATVLAQEAVAASAVELALPLAAWVSVVTMVVITTTPIWTKAAYMNVYLGAGFGWCGCGANCTNGDNYGDCGGGESFLKHWAFPFRVVSDVYCDDDEKVLANLL